MIVTKTCPHCNEVADRNEWSMDTGDLDGILIPWKCDSCGKLFYTRMEDEDNDKA